MSLKLIKLVFKVGGLLAITPAKMGKRGLFFPSKAYALLWIILLTAAVVVSAVYKKASYENLTSVLLTLSVATDIILFVFNLCTIMTTVTKRHQWIKFFKILKTLQSNNNEHLFYLLPFLITNVIFVINFGYETYLWSQIMGAEFYKTYAVEYFQCYSQFIVYFLVYAFLKLILDNVRNISRNINRLKMQPNRLNNCALKALKTDFLALAECIDIFSDIFGSLILLLMGFCILQQLTYLHSLVVKSSRDTISILVYKIMFITWHMVGTFISFFLCDMIEQGVRHVEMVAHQIETICVEEETYFTAARFFNLNRKTFLGTVNALFTFLIVGIQFENFKI
ncbi:gustatory receptor 64 [Tribolium castaneum]|uniref:Gustatory receptor n=1 Tax=Tribolium castaneum TaxID=7070 RepID=D7EIQ6_TRICA|nr:gustatory receptor 64 [Tribolium castaneum]